MSGDSPSSPPSLSLSSSSSVKKIAFSSVSVEDICKQFGLDDDGTVANQQLSNDEFQTSITEEAKSALVVPLTSAELETLVETITNKFQDRFDYMRRSFDTPGANERQVTCFFDDMMMPIMANVRGRIDEDQHRYLRMAYELTGQDKTSTSQYQGRFDAVVCWNERLFLITEAKATIHDEAKALAQNVAQLDYAMRNNSKKHPVFGAVTSMSQWVFYRYDGKQFVRSGKFPVFANYNPKSHKWDKKKVEQSLYSVVQLLHTIILLNIRRATPASTPVTNSPTKLEQH